MVRASIYRDPLDSARRLVGLGCGEPEGSVGEAISALAEGDGLTDLEPDRVASGPAEGTTLEISLGIPYGVGAGALAETASVHHALASVGGLVLDRRHDDEPSIDVGVIQSGQAAQSEAAKNRARMGAGFESAGLRIVGYSQPAL